MTLPLLPSPWMTEEHHALADSVARYIAERWVPRAAEFRETGRMPPEAWRDAAANGLLCVSTPAEYGGGSGDFSHEAVILLEQSRANCSGWGGGLHSAIVAPYLLHYGTESQKRRFLPRLCSAELIGAIAMTEPGTGSDLQAIRTTARRDGDHYVLNGAKTFITNGQNANLVIVVARTGGEGAKGVSLLLVETERSPGFRRGRQLDKIGLKSQDTSELFFDDVRVPAANLLGEAEGQGFFQLMQQLPQERLIIAVQGIGAMERALEETVRYAKERKAFGRPIWDFQNTRFKLAEVQATVLAARAFVDACMVAHLKGELDAARAALAKAWVSEQQGRVMDECLQLFGGYGYMMEYPIAELFVDARVQRIYGGTNEIMKELASRSM
ncbi:acyl-CoA dehydrogenase family protein [Rubrivivax albus]|uniref:Acyl-[acyl-carrier-protein] dehydrogenase MbtN n=1 Tax=Rubrivivax albus TaxID=2499835 RepID=A0A3S2TZK7_9BURK|nr:acyl-CoA dehydrogenase family protein [Rubrivivax albus]RVT48421.1 acyl-CoA dehydrogenase [Rubrivivax albus]